MNLVLIVFFTLLGSICSVGLAALLLLFKRKRLSLVTDGLIPYATGGLRSLAWELPLIAFGIGTIVALRLSAAR